MKPVAIETRVISHPRFLLSILVSFSFLLILGGCAGIAGQDSQQSVLAPSSAAEFPKAKTVVVYYEDDPTQDWNYGITYAIMMRNLLGHFSTVVTLANVKEYVSGDLNRYDSVIYIGSLYDYPLSDAFSSDALNASKPFMWINYNIWKLFDKPDWNAEAKLGFKYLNVDRITPFNKIIYKGQDLPRLDSDVEYNIVSIDVGSKCSVGAHIELQQKEQSVKAPYSIRCGDFFYMAQNPFANFFASYLVVADTLHDFLGTNVQPSMRALVRLEDITPGNVNYEMLRREVDTLNKMGIPFAFGIIPVNYDPLGVTGKAGKLIPLHKDFLLQDLIRYMISKGGTPVMHGYTHQHDTNSAMDFEFWNGKEDKPFPEDSFDWALDRIDKGIEEYKTALGFSPVIWETPHYSASPNTYFAVAERFRVAYERLPTFNSLEIPKAGSSIDYSKTKYISITAPYQLFDTFYGFRLIPENLGYLEKGGIPELGFPPTPQGKADLAQMVTVVRDGLVSFMFHHWQPEADLYDTIQRIQKMGYTFVSVNDLLKETPPAYQ
jgi:uncharacterized protein YdaL